MVLPSAGVPRPDLSLTQIATEFGDARRPICFSHYLRDHSSGIVKGTDTINNTIPTIIHPAYPSRRPPLPASTLDMSDFYGARRMYVPKVKLYQTSDRKDGYETHTTSSPNLVSWLNDGVSCVEVFPRTIVQLYGNPDYQFDDDDSVVMINPSYDRAFYINIAATHLNVKISSFRITSVEYGEDTWWFGPYTNSMRSIIRFNLFDTTYLLVYLHNFSSLDWGQRLSTLSPRCKVFSEVNRSGSCLELQAERNNDVSSVSVSCVEIYPYSILTLFSSTNSTGSILCHIVNYSPTGIHVFDFANEPSLDNMTNSIRMFSFNVSEWYGKFTSDISMFILRERNNMYGKSVVYKADWSYFGLIKS